LGFVVECGEASPLWDSDLGFWEPPALTTKIPKEKPKAAMPRRTPQQKPKALARELWLLLPKV
jgi:hypothetical protein